MTVTNATTWRDLRANFHGQLTAMPVQTRTHADKLDRELTLTVGVHLTTSEWEVRTLTTLVLPSPAGDIVSPANAWREPPTAAWTGST